MCRKDSTCVLQVLIQERCPIQLINIYFSPSTEVVAVNGGSLWARIWTSNSFIITSVITSSCFLATPTAVFSTHPLHTDIVRFYYRCGYTHLINTTSPRATRSHYLGAKHVGRLYYWSLLTVLENNCVRPSSHCHKLLGPVYGTYWATKGAY